MKKKLLFLTATYLFAVVSLHAQIITTVAGGAQGFSGDGGQATSAALDDPDGIAIDDSGNIYISDQDNYRIRKVTVKTGIINTIVGQAFAGFAGDGGPATDAKINGAVGIALDDSGNLYIADGNNSRIRKVSKATGIITTVAGDSSYGYHGDGGLATAASLFQPSGVAFDDSGNIYIADLGNSLIRKVNSSTHKMSTIAGIPFYAGYSGDNGQATAAKLFGPADVALDDSGNIYISDNVNSRIRKITKATGIITTIAGKGIASFSGDNGLADSAEIDYPFGLTVDDKRNVYFADEGNNRVREIDASTGIITTYAGGGTTGLGDGGPPDSAEFSEPIAVAFDQSGNMYIDDQLHNRIRKMTINATGINRLSAKSEQLLIYPNPGNGVFIVESAGIARAKWNLYDLLGKQLKSGEFSNAQKSEFYFSFLPEGNYILNVFSPEINETKKIAIVK